MRSARFSNVNVCVLLALLMALLNTHTHSHIAALLYVMGKSFECVFTWQSETHISRTWPLKPAKQPQECFATILQGGHMPSPSKRRTYLHESQVKTKELFCCCCCRIAAAIVVLSCLNVSVKNARRKTAGRNSKPTGTTPLMPPTHCWCLQLYVRVCVDIYFCKYIFFFLNKIHRLCGSACEELL